VVAPAATLRLDVDDLGDLGGALVLGVGPHTEEALSGGQPGVDVGGELGGDADGGPPEG
jgi:2-phospho-L-lactate guanylyltransferase